MKSFGSSLFVLAVCCFTPGFHAGAQLFTAEVSDPANPVVSYDEDPYVYTPPVPAEPTVIYQGGVGTGATVYTTDPIVAQQPRVITTKTPPDSYTLNRSPWNKWFYYKNPLETPVTAAGPYTALPVPAKFDFGTATSPVEPGHTRVTPDTLYGPGTGYGFGYVGPMPGGGEWTTGVDTGKGSNANRDYIVLGSTTDPSDNNYRWYNAFYADVPNGRYRVEVVVGARAGVRVDSMPFVASLNAGVPASFLVEVGRDAVSTTRLGADGMPLAMQKSGRIRFEFIGSPSRITSITITPATDADWNKPTVFTASDSTVSSYGVDPGPYPYNTGLQFMGWGEALPNYFTSGLRINNEALAGRSSRSFVEEGVLDAISNRMKPGDELFVMFAINDSADVIPTADNPNPYNNRNTKPDTTHKAWTRLYIREARRRGALPVLVTSQIKCTYDQWGRFTNSVQGYPQADRDLGGELGVPVLDLNRMSIDYLTALGPKPDDGDPTTARLPEATRWYRTNPNGTVNDYIHLCPYGANQYAGLVARLARQAGLPIAQYLKEVAPTRPISGKR